MVTKKWQLSAQTCEHWTDLFQKITFMSINISFLQHLFLSSRILNTLDETSPHIQYGEINLQRVEK